MRSKKVEKKEVGCRFDFVTPRPSVTLKGPELSLPGRETQQSHVQGRWGRRGQTWGPVFACPGPPLLNCPEDGAPDGGRPGDCKLSHATGADVCDTLRDRAEERGGQGCLDRAESWSTLCSRDGRWFAVHLMGPGLRSPAQLDTALI